MTDYLKFKKFAIPIINLVLILYSFIDIDLGWWFLRENITLISLIIFLFLIFLFELLTIIVIKLFIKSSIHNLSSHFLINALNEKDYATIIIQFSLIIIFEELIFRLYLFTYISRFFNLFLAFILSSSIFGLYHLHIWYEFKDKRLTCFFVLMSCLLGIILGFLLYCYGLFISIIIHFSISLGFFYYVKTNLPH